jgi:hypothetical protein
LIELKDTKKQKTNKKQKKIKDKKIFIRFLQIFLGKNTIILKTGSKEKIT